jgi:hypothetical protein
VTEIWIEQTETRIRVRANVDAPASALFGVLADPRRHAEIVLARVRFPRVQPDELAATVRALEAAAQ